MCKNAQKQNFDIKSEHSTTPREKNSGHEKALSLQKYPYGFA